MKTMAVTVRTGRDSDAQMTTFQNATLQSGTGECKVAFSIATFVEVPAEIQDDEEKVAEFLREKLSKVAAVHPEISFEVEVGEDRR